MGKLSESELERKIALKRIRNIARTECSIRADRLLNEIEAEFEREFDKRVAEGRPFILDSYEMWVSEAVNKAIPRG